MGADQRSLDGKWSLGKVLLNSGRACQAHIRGFRIDVPREAVSSPPYNWCLMPLSLMLEPLTKDEIQKSGDRLVPTYIKPSPSCIPRFLGWL